MVKEKKYYTFQRILKFLSFDYKFTKKDEYPFTKNKEDVTFSWGQILIPKYGIMETVQNKISDIDEKPISEITMMYQIPFIVDNKCGIINQNIILGFKYDKTYKYGNINKSIYEVCFWILEHAIRTNDFYIITDDNIQTFMSYYVIDNQWGLGSTTVTSPCNEKMTSNKKEK